MAMNQDGIVLATNQAGGSTLPNITLIGGLYVMDAVASAYGTNGVELKLLGPDGSTLLSMSTPMKLTANGCTAATYLPPGTYQAVLDALVTGMYARIARAPN